VDYIARILVAEDDVSSRELLRRRLEKRGFHVDEVGDGEACLARLEQDPQPDLILLDIHMPGKTGIHVVREIRTTRAHTQLPVIMVTGLKDSDEVIRGLHSGANDYVVKPINFPVLLARIFVSLSLKEGADRLIEAERQRVMLESLGAACHHIGQPMTSVFGTLHMMKQHLPADDEQLAKDLQAVHTWAEKVGEIIHQMQLVTQYRTVPYTGSSKIIDLG